MQDFEISLTIDLNHQMVEQVIDDAISTTGLITTLRCTLKKYPECVHWHVKNGREPGILEVTYWPMHQRLWFTIQEGRKSTWIKDKMGLLEKAIQQNIKSVRRKQSGK